MSYKMFVCDLDGTMFDWSLIAHEDNKKSIKKAVDAGVIFVIATGRPCYSAVEIANSFELNSDGQYVICFNGGCIAKAGTGEILFETKIKDEYAHYILKHIKSFNCSVVAYVNRKPHAYRKDEQTARYAETTAGSIIYDEHFDKNDAIGCNKILIRGANKDLENIRRSIEEWADGKVECFFSAENLFEFTQLGVSKGRAMMELANMLNVKKEEIIAIGDYYNDISMIQAAGFGVAVKDAPDAVKECASYITEKSAPDGAVSEAIERFVFGVKNCIVG